MGGASHTGLRTKGPPSVCRRSLGPPWQKLLPVVPCVETARTFPERGLLWGQGRPAQVPRASPPQRRLADERVRVLVYTPPPTPPHLLTCHLGLQAARAFGVPCRRPLSSLAHLVQLAPGPQRLWSPLTSLLLRPPRPPSA